MRIFKFEQIWIRFRGLRIPEIANQKVKISAISKTLNKSDILALIAYLQFSIGQIHFGGFAFFAIL
jgi:hypothetical protein